MKCGLTHLHQQRSRVRPRCYISCKVLRSDRPVVWKQTLSAIQDVVTVHAKMKNLSMCHHLLVTQRKWNENEKVIWTTLWYFYSGLCSTIRNKIIWDDMRWWWWWRIFHFWLNYFSNTPLNWLLGCVECTAAGGLVVLHSVLQFMTHVQVTECSSSEGRNLQSILNACQAASQCYGRPCAGKRRHNTPGVYEWNTHEIVVFFFSSNKKCHKCTYSLICIICKI